MKRYKVHIDYFNIDFTFNNIQFNYPNRSGSWLLELNQSFNLYNWVRENIYLPHINDTTAYDSDWHTIITWLPKGELGNTRHDYVTQMRFTFNPTSVLKGIVRVQTRWNTYEGWVPVRYIDYSFTGNQSEVSKFLDINIYPDYAYEENGVRRYITQFIIGGYNIYDMINSNKLTYEDVPLNACPYVNEQFYFEPGTHSIYGGFSSTTNFYEVISGVEITDDDESEQDNYSGEGGGKGVVDDRSDYIPMDGLPLVSVISSGFVNLYSPTLGNIQSLHEFMMGDDFLNNVKKLIANPIDYIISLHLIPVSPTTLGSQSIKVGGIDTQVSMPVISSQYVQFDCGTLNIEEYWGSFIDYSPFTKVSIFLPFVGIKELNLDDVMAGQVSVSYRIDVLTGNFICSLQVSSSRKVNAVLYNYSGNMSMHVPVSASDFREKINAFTGLIGSGAMVAVSGGANPSADIAYASNLANVALSKYGYSRSGSTTGDASILGNYTPYLIIARPNQSLASKYKGLNGYTSNIGGTVGQFSGFNKFGEIKLDGLTCLEEEKQMIGTMLRDGIFV